MPRTQKWCSDEDTIILFAAFSGDSPTSKRPPGNPHFPLNGRFVLFIRNMLPLFLINTNTTGIIACFVDK